MIKLLNLLKIIGLSTCYALSFGCQPQTRVQSPSQAPLLPSPALPSSEPSPELYSTAREGLAQAQKLAQSKLPQAQLTFISGQWIDSGGRSREWSYTFVDAESQEEI